MLHIHTTHPPDALQQRDIHMDNRGSPTALIPIFQTVLQRDWATWCRQGTVSPPHPPHTHTHTTREPSTQTHAHTTFTEFPRNAVDVVGLEIISSRDVRLHSKAHNKQQQTTTANQPTNTQSAKPPAPHCYCTHVNQHRHQHVRSVEEVL